jgi:TRAP-type transport system periplasmic protein
VMQNKKIYDSALNLLDSHGIVGGMVAGQAVGYYIAREPLRRLSDFKGKKMRVNATDAERLRMKRLGATAIPMGLAQMVTSLQNGTIDGTMSGLTIHVNFHLETISKILLQTDDTMLVSFTGISKKWLDTLPPDLSKTIVQTMRGMQPQFVAFANEDDRDLKKEWLARGGSFITWSKADMTKFHQLIGDVGEVVTRKNPELHAYYEMVKGISSQYH